jgi:hypothetical protein
MLFMIKIKATLSQMQFRPLVKGEHTIRIQNPSRRKSWGSPVSKPKLKSKQIILEN